MEESDNKRVNKSFPILSSYSSFSLPHDYVSLLSLLSFSLFSILLSLFYPSLSFLSFSLFYPSIVTRLLFSLSVSSPNHIPSFFFCLVTLLCPSTVYSGVYFFEVYSSKVLVLECLHSIVCNLSAINIHFLCDLTTKLLFSSLITTLSLSVS